MKVNKRKLKIILLIIVLCIVFIAVCIVGHHFIEKKVQKSQTIAMCDIIERYMKEDEIFQNKYGKVDMVRLCDTEKRQKINKTTFRIPCIVTVSEGKKEYFVWVGFEVINEKVEITYYSVTLKL